MAKNPETEKPVQVSAATAETKAEKPKKARGQISGNAVAFLVGVLVLGYLIFATWQGYTVTNNAPIVAATATPSLPALKLNQDNTRQGPEIDVNTDEIGKENPFQ